ncbi:threonine-phosphate decarboxylase CobD [Hyphomicrobium sp. MC1]|uniref:threonine-phosphate decarboxylase CobD n=1 Tax=Hyphomicrobium sp. (strain MC1) TaxID=717785 RepID=UPI000213F1E5|nr:threonine-phosphate decarboxylase CobD [Hyphomicrobium sp. MC1]CCB65502.1 Threonine-phosphate decarboxylase [Hyphomicrobium sp. MC1]
MSRTTIPTPENAADHYRHGGDIDQARRNYPNAIEPWIDLSTGINPFAYPIPTLESDAWTRLPLKEEEFELRSASAFCYGAPDVDAIVSAPGTQALIQIIPRLIEPTQVAIIGPTYSEHARCWQRLGHSTMEIETLDEIESARVVVVVNPNNPTGRHYAPQQLLSLAEEMTHRRGLLIVDEAFADLLGIEHSVVPLEPPSTIILRSFGKTYGLAGLRLGFAITQRKTAAQLREWLGPWAVSGPALAIGRQALKDSRWLADMRGRVKDARERLERLLVAAGCDVLGGTPLFLLASHPRAANVAHTLATNAIHVRQFSDQPTWLRFGIPQGSAWRRIEAALLSLSP